MTEFLPQPYPLFLAVSGTERASLVSRVVAWQVDTDPAGDGPDLVPVTLIGTHAPGAVAELDDIGRLYAYGATADEARAALAQLVEQRPPAVDPIGDAVAVLAALHHGDDQGAAAVLTVVDPAALIGPLIATVAQLGPAAVGPDAWIEALTAWQPGQAIGEGLAR